MGLFKHVKFHISGGQEEPVLSKLIAGGGQRSRYLNASLTVNIVTDRSKDEAELEEAKEVRVI